MLEKIIPEYIFCELNSIGFDNIEEIHLRANSNVVIVSNSNKKTLNKGRLGIIPNKELLENIVLKASNYSLYSVQNQLKNGYLTLENGIRIGISGEFSYDNFNVKNIYSLNIRLPHQVKNCSKNVFPKLFSDGQFLNTLILSPPSAGKTTLLRDILYQFNFLDKIYNIALIDDRNEISALKNGLPSCDLYKHIDIISNLDKYKGIMLAIKNLNPDIIATDEITEESDCIAIEKTFNNGINIISTIHGKNIDELQRKDCLKNILRQKIFDRFIILSKINTTGEIVAILDNKFNQI